MKVKKIVLKKTMPMLLAVGILFGISGCGTADAPKTEAKKPVILAVSFGTSYNESCEATIGAIEQALQDANPDYEVRRTFTSQSVIDILEEREQLEIDNVTEAIERLITDGVREVVIQPTHVMTGYEYDDVVAEVNQYTEQFDKVTFSAPLLVSDADYDALVSSIAEETATFNEDGTAVVLMGHGTEHQANETYAMLQQKFVNEGYLNYFVGTVEAEPALEDVMALVKESGAKKVVLLPLMIVAGDHANNDMAGDEEDSWKTAFINEGYEVECVLKGLGQYQGVQQIFVDHASSVITK